MYVSMEARAKSQRVEEVTVGYKGVMAERSDTKSRISGVRKIGRSDPIRIRQSSSASFFFPFPLPRVARAEDR